MVLALTTSYNWREKLEDSIKISGTLGHYPIIFLSSYSERFLLKLISLAVNRHIEYNRFLLNLLVTNYRV